MVLAFSLQSDVKSIGAYAGFAAIIGLALLVLLYFAQAREVRRLSDLLEQQEDRLRGLPALARQPIPRPVVGAPGREVPTPQMPAGQAASAAPTATVAVPGVRRVAVGGAAAGAAADATPALRAAGVVGAAGAAAEVGEPGKAVAPVAAATVAGAMAAVMPGVPSPDAPVAPPAGDDAARVERPDEAATADPAGSRGAGAGEGTTPSASVPLIARPAATAEPLGSAQLLDGTPAAPDDVTAVSSDTAETAIVEGVATGQPAESESAEELGAGAVAVAALVPEPAGEISAERLEPSVFDFTAEPAAEPASLDDGGHSDAMAGAEEDEPAPLAPSTAAGARPRFPPPPSPARAMPVAAAAAAGAAVAGEGALEGAVPDGAAAATRRREPPPTSADGEDLEPHAGGSVLRLLAAAVVIVAVLIFIATKVFSTGGSHAPRTAVGPTPATVTVAVLNGTHTSGLANQVADRLDRLGFKQGTIGNALSHGHHYTLVGYLTQAGRAAAKEVAKDLAPTPTRVGPADPDTVSIVEAAGGAPQVVVTLGSEYAAR
jgi:hypothetical protein